jgi:phage recombination protein Bet
MTEIIEVENNEVKAVALTQEKKSLLKNTICSNLLDTEFELFLGICERTKLDPFSKQIYGIKRGSKLVIQVGIDGFRSIAERTGERDGEDVTLWCGNDGVWYDVWLQDIPPAACKVTVHRKGCSRPFSAVARYKSYCVSSNPLWRSMPEVMLAKCAESLALRKAFPQVLSGLYTSDEMGQADNNEPIRIDETQQYDPNQYRQQTAQQNYQDIQNMRYT